MDCFACSCLSDTTCLPCDQSVGANWTYCHRADAVCTGKACLQGTSQLQRLQSTVRPMASDSLPRVSKQCCRNASGDLLQLLFPESWSVDLVTRILVSV